MSELEPQVPEVCPRTLFEIALEGTEVSGDFEIRFAPENSRASRQVQIVNLRKVHSSQPQGGDSFQNVNTQNQQ